MASQISLESRMDAAQAALDASSSRNKERLPQQSEKTGALLTTSLTFSTYLRVCKGGRLQAISDAANDQDAQALKSVAAAAFSVVKTKISSFAQHSKFVVDVLDDLSKAHPIIAGMPFTSCIYLRTLTQFPPSRGCSIQSRVEARTRSRGQRAEGSRIARQDV
jgi:hypothetical protein